MKKVAIIFLALSLVAGVLLILSLTSCMTLQITYEGTVTKVWEGRGQTYITFESGAVCVVHKYFVPKIEVGKRYRLKIDAVNYEYEILGVEK